jgi:predicted RNase H-like HicB family nuclease
MIQQEIKMRYTVILEQEEDGGLVACVPALPGCVSQGDNRPEALRNIREAIELYVEDCREAGDPVPTEAGKEFVEVDAA